MVGGGLDSLGLVADEVQHEDRLVLWIGGVDGVEKLLRECGVVLCGHGD